MTITSVGLAAAAIWMSPQDVPQPKADPMLSKLMPSEEREPRHLAELVRTEVRDAAWAEQAEATLRQRYAPLVNNGSIKIVRLSCAATACEVVGTTGERDPKRVNVTWRALQDAKLNEVRQQYRVKHAAMAFGADNLFAAYWVRTG
jgi:hypothetical protein